MSLEVPQLGNTPLKNKEMLSDIKLLSNASIAILV